MNWAAESPAAWNFANCYPKPAQRLAGLMGGSGVLGGIQFLGGFPQQQAAVINEEVFALDRAAFR